MNILVLGATGMAGHTISLYFAEKGHKVTAFSNTPFTFCDNIVGDAFDEAFVRKMVVSDNYDAVINCIGILNKSADENKAAAVYLNSYLPHMLVSALKNTDTKVIHMSTDCVFSGVRGEYCETDFQDGETFYDRTKALGEINDSKNLTFRNSIIGPDINSNGIGLFNWFMKQKSEIKGYASAIWTGVTTLTLAKAMERAIDDNLTGLYNLVNNESISKYNLCSLFNKYFKNNELKIKPDYDVKTNKSLKNTRKDFKFIVPVYEDMVVDMKEWVIAHRGLYSHYEI